MGLWARERQNPVCDLTDQSGCCADPQMQGQGKQLRGHSGDSATLQMTEGGGFTQVAAEEVVRRVRFQVYFE